MRVTYCTSRLIHQTLHTLCVESSHSCSCLSSRSCQLYNNFSCCLLLNVFFRTCLGPVCQVWPGYHHHHLRERAQSQPWLIFSIHSSKYNLFFFMSLHLNLYTSPTLSKEKDKDTFCVMLCNDFCPSLSSLFAVLKKEGEKKTQQLLESESGRHGNHKSTTVTECVPHYPPPSNTPRVSHTEWTTRK